MKLAIFLNQSITAGGGYYESLNRVSQLSNTDLYITFFTSNKNIYELLKEEGRDVSYVDISAVDRFFLFCRKKIIDYASHVIPGNVIPSTLVKKLLPKFNKFEQNFKKRGVDIVYFTSPESNAVYLESTNYIFAVWDLAHYEIPFFPEIRENAVFETREFLYRKVLPRAYAITVGHSYAKKTLVEKYQQDPEKIFVLPFLPSPRVVEMESKIDVRLIDDLPKNLPDRYLYYPAQYATHKNHALIIELVCLAKQRGMSIGAVFTGADRGNMKYLKSKVASLGLQRDIIFLDFQSDSSVFALFKFATAVIVPTYIGPGTLPTMEAMFLGAPVIVLDNHQNRDFYGDSVHYVSRRNLGFSIDFIESLLSGASLDELSTKMKARYEQIINSGDEDLFSEYILEFSNILQTYGEPLD